MSIFFVNKPEANDKNAFVRAFTWLNTSNATEKSVVFNDKKNFRAVLEFMEFDNSSINKIWKEKKIPSRNGNQYKVYTLQTLDAIIRGDIISIYISIPDINKIHNISGIRNILAVPWNNNETTCLKSIGAIEI